jgi:superfamily II DNA or RNA helicase
MSIKIEPYQERAAEWLSRRKVGMVVAPAGCGKTICASLALQKVILRKPRTRKVKIGWLANTHEQCQQAQDALDKFPEMLPWLDVKIACAAAETDWSDRDGLVIDEAHHLEAPSWLSQALSCKGVWWGFTATPETGDEERDAKLIARFNGQVFTVDRSEVAARVASARVIMLDATDDGLRERIDAAIQQMLPKRRTQMDWLARNKGVRVSDGEVYAQVSFQCCVELGIVQNAARNREALSTIQSHSGDQVLALVNQVEHAQRMAGHVKGAIACFAAMGMKKRRAAIAAFREGEIKCLVATSLADEGLDLPNANVMVLVSGGRSESKTIQRTGRVLRTHGGKTHGLIYDWRDDFHPLTAKHSQVRQRLYEKLGYTFG